MNNIFDVYNKILSVVIHNNINTEKNKDLIEGIFLRMCMKNNIYFDTDELQYYLEMLNKRVIDQYIICDIKINDTIIHVSVNTIDVLDDIIHTNNFDALYVTDRQFPLFNNTLDYIGNSISHYNNVNIDIKMISNIPGWFIKRSNITLTPDKDLSIIFHRCYYTYFNKRFNISTIDEKQSRSIIIPISKYFSKEGIYTENLHGNITFTATVIHKT